MKNRKLKRSFYCAIKGVWEAVQTEQNIRIHIAIASMVVFFGLLLQVDTVRWALLFGLCGLVISAELLNTSLERLVDMVTNEVCEEARRVKDMAAGAVFITAIAAAAGGIAVFWEPARILLTTFF